jgi:hypothetical protein
MSSGQVFASIIGAIAAVLVAIINNWEKIGPPVVISPSPLPTALSTPPQAPISPSLSSLYTPEIKSVIQNALLTGQQSYKNLDESLLEKVFVGEALTLLQGSINDFKSRGVRIDTQYSNIQYGDISFTDSPLRVNVEFTRIVRVFEHSIDTDKCMGSTPEYSQSFTYSLKQQSDKWVIFGIVLNTPTPPKNSSCN